MSKSKLTDQEWDRIYKEKFEDPNYYNLFYRQKMTSQSSLSEPTVNTRVGRIHDITDDTQKRSPRLGYIMNGHSKITY